jgi:chaperonin GroEL
LVIIAESFDTSVTQGLAMNIFRTGGQLKIACVEAPGFGDRRLEILRDMGVYLGATVADDPMGIKYETMSTADFGKCEKIIIKKDETIIRGGKGDPVKIEARIKSIEGLIGALKENDGWEREQLGKRLASLTTGVAVIQVGGSSEEELKEFKDRLDDATWAVKAALEEGYVPGAGVTLLRISSILADKLKPSSEDEALGVKIFVDALKAPFRRIIENSGSSPESVMKNVLANDNSNYGFNVKTLQYVDLLENGIIDPLKVVKGVIYAATSIASVILTSNVIITDDPVDEKGLSLNMMPSDMM